MKARILLTVCLLSCLPAARSQVLVSEDFESYTDTSDLRLVWAEPAGSATTAAGQLVDETYTQFITLDDIDPQPVGARAFPEGGQGVEHLGGLVMEYRPGLGATPLLPTATKNIVLQGDIFDVGALGNKRISIGLRSVAAVQNIIELGHWNANASELAHRSILYPEPSLRPEPNWQFYELPIELDRPDDADELTTLADLGEAWHTHRVTIGVDFVTYEIDLFRDGIDARTGESGFDASVTYDGVITSAAGYDSLRFGGPSNVTSGGNGFYGGSIFDNISIELVDVGEVPLVGDYNSDGRVDAADYTVWRDTLNSTTDLRADGNENGIVDGPIAGVGNDYDLWVENYGNPPPLATAVPEPASLLSLLAAGLLLAAKRR